MKRPVLATLGTVTGIVLLLGFKSAPTRAARPPFVSPLNASEPPVVDSSAASANIASSAPISSAAASTPSADPATQATAQTPTPAPSTSRAPAPTKTPTRSAAPPPTAVSATFLGTSVQTRYGPVQIKITYAGGRVTGVVAVQLPSGRSRDAEINSYAVPILESETLAAQSANINAVSGATYTSDGYVRSLQSALDAIPH
jgi:uncharacterized protein with FMN-binding domain